MSTVKTNNVQIGQSVTATNNGTWYQPSTPDGTIRYGIGNAGATTSDVVTLTSAGNLGIGTSSPSTKLTVYDASTPQVTFNNGTSSFIVGNNNGGNNHILYGTGAYPIIFYTNSAEAMRLDSSGNLGLGVTPSGWSAGKAIEIGNAGDGLSINYGVGLNLNRNAYYNGGFKYGSTDYASRYAQASGQHQWYTAPSGTAGNAISFTQAMTLDASGKLTLNAIDFSIGGGTSPAIYRSGANGSGIHFSTNSGLPANETGTISDNTESWGVGAWRWSVIYAATGTINTSDRNEKQDIADLTSAELSVAADLKNLFKTFRWKDAVAKKGDSARIHVGVIAQDVWDTFSKHGLNASRYALWCEDVWYEVDGHNMDNNSVPYTAEAVGAVRVTRYGVRYDQLLAFILAAI